MPWQSLKKEEVTTAPSEFLSLISVIPITRKLLVKFKTMLPLFQINSFIAARGSKQSPQRSRAPPAYFPDSTVALCSTSFVAPDL